MYYINLIHISESHPPKREPTSSHLYIRSTKLYSIFNSKIFLNKIFYFISSFLSKRQKSSNILANSQSQLKMVNARLGSSFEFVFCNIAFSLEICWMSIIEEREMSI